MDAVSEILVWEEDSWNLKMTVGSLEMPNSVASYTKNVPQWHISSIAVNINKGCIIYKTMQTENVWSVFHISSLKTPEVSEPGKRWYHWYHLSLMPLFRGGHRFNGCRITSFNRWVSTGGSCASVWAKKWRKKKCAFILKGVFIQWNAIYPYSITVGR